MFAAVDRGCPKGGTLGGQLVHAQCKEYIFPVLQQAFYFMCLSSLKQLPICVFKQCHFIQSRIKYYIMPSDIQNVGIFAHPQYYKSAWEQQILQQPKMGVCSIRNITHEGRLRVCAINDAASDYSESRVLTVNLVPTNTKKCVVHVRQNVFR